MRINKSVVSRQLLCYYAVVKGVLQTMSHLVSIEELGNMIRTKRTEMKLSYRELDSKSGVDKGMILNIEQGKKKPSTATLSKLSKALNLPLADLYHLAGYEVPGELPSPPIYFRTKYKHLPPEAQKEMEDSIKKIQKRYAKNKGPAPGEDEV